MDLIHSLPPPMLDCCIAIAYWVNRKFYSLSQLFSPESMILAAECIPNLASKILRDAGSIEVALIFFMPRDDKSEASSRDASAIVGYEDFLSELKSRISKAQLRAVVAINKELILLYWQIGQDILNRQQQQGWGAKVINRLAADLHKAFPEIKGFSVRNLKYMRAFAEAYPDEELVQQVVALIPWGHNVRILDTVKDQTERLWYVQQTIGYGWSRNVLVHQIESKLYHRQGKASTNFKRTLPQPQSELAQQLLKDPYTFDFLNLGEDFLERDLERALINHIRDFLVELGVGFAFVR